MSETFYALIHSDQAGHYGLSFPDAPGVIAAGTSVEDTVAAGRKALRSNFNALEDEGLPLPRPRSLDALLADPDFRTDRSDALAVIALEPAPRTGRSIRINISIDEFALERIDDLARRKGLTRSRLLVEGALRAG
jgi:predicted RNase H-like HicB family nuclease